MDFTVIGRLGGLYKNLFDLYGRAPETAQIAAQAALFLGGLGLACLLVVVFLYARDVWFIGHARHGRRVMAPPRLGFVAHTMGGILNRGAVKTHLSHDAAMSYVQSRIDAVSSTIAGMLKFFAYAPLLVGLMGTMLGLADLLPAARDAQLSDARFNLDAVFVGTLFGILGSLIGTVALVISSSLLGSLTSQIENHIHDHILPLIHPPALTVKIEQFVEPIREKVHEAMQPFTDELQKLSVALAAHAQISTDAATKAVEAFRVASDAAGKAGVFDLAADHFESAIQELVKSTGVLSELSESATTAAVASAALGTQLTAVTGTTLGLSSTLQSASLSLEQVSTALNGTIGEFSQHAKTMGTSLDQFEKTCNRLADLHSTIKTEIVATQNIMKDLANSTAEQINAELEARMNRICTTLETTIQGVKNPIEQATDGLRAEQMRLKETGRDVERILPRLDDRLVKVTSELDRMASSMEQMLALRATPASGEQSQRLANAFEPLSVDLGQLVEHLERQLAELQAVRSLLTERLSRPPERIESRGRWWPPKWRRRSRAGAESSGPEDTIAS